MTIPLKTTRVYYTTTRHLSIDSSWEELQFQLYIIYAAILVHFCHIIVIMTVLHNNKPNDFWRKKNTPIPSKFTETKSQKGDDILIADLFFYRWKIATFSGLLPFNLSFHINQKGPTQKKNRAFLQTGTTLFNYSITWSVCAYQSYSFV